MEQPTTPGTRHETALVIALDPGADLVVFHRASRWYTIEDHTTVLGHHPDRKVLAYPTVEALVEDQGDLWPEAIEEIRGLSTARTCLTCTHWKLDKYTKPRGRCNAIPAGLDEGDADDTLAIANDCDSCGAANLCTMPAFSCLLWKAKKR